MLDEVIVKYGLDITELRAEMAEIKKHLSDTADTAKDSAKKTEDALNNVGANVKGKLNEAFSVLGKTIAGVFAVERIGAFISSSIELATRTQELKNAFDKLNSPALLSNLQKATEGTLSNLQLMGVAVKANNLQIPLEKLGTILKFAKQRADELGQSTEDLANTLIQGIGVKSTRALVQVGISQEQFGTEVKKTGDYFKALDSIMTTTLDKAGEGFDSVADKQERLRASVENAKAAIGDDLLPIIAKLDTALVQVLEGWKQILDPKGAGFNEGFASMNEVLSKARVNFENLDGLIHGHQDQIEKLNKEYNNLNAGIGSIFSLRRQREISEQIGQEQGMIAAIQDFQKAQTKSTESTEQNTDALKDNNDELAKRIPLFTFLLNAAQDTALPIQTFGIDVNKTADAMLAAADAAVQLKPALKGVGDQADETKMSAEELWQVWTQFGEQSLNQIDELFANSVDYQLSLLKQRNDQGLLSNAKYEEETAKLQRKAAERSKTLHEFEIVLQIAENIVAAGGNPLKILLATISGFAQLAIVQGAPVPAFKKGVVDYKGKGTETSDENLVRISNHESIIRASATRKHKMALDAINNDRFEEYLLGYLPKLVKKSHSDIFEDRNIVRAIYEEVNVSRETNKILKDLKRNENRRRQWN